MIGWICDKGVGSRYNTGRNDSKALSRAMANRESVTAFNVGSDCISHLPMTSKEKPRTRPRMEGRE